MSADYETLMGRIEELNGEVSELRYLLRCAVARLDLAENRADLVDARFAGRVERALGLEDREEGE